MHKKTKSYFITAGAVLISALLHSFAIKAFVRPAGLISAGFTGIAVLVDMLTEQAGLHIDTSLAMIFLNILVAAFCFKRISPRFTFFSCLQVALCSLFVRILPYTPIMEDPLLLSVFGGFINGMAIVTALKGNASTGGTDFIALYFSNKYNKPFWNYVFGMNSILIVTLGFTRGWIYAAYSVIFQFISTRTISTLHTRYDRLTLQITTEKPEDILKSYVAEYKHGISCMNGYGGFSRKPFCIMTTVVSSYEVKDIIQLIKAADEKAIVNIMQTKDFVGGFHPKPID